jgi:heat shock protein beta
MPWGVQADDKFEYADAVRIQNLVKNYSQFISFPIYTWQEKSQTKEVDDDGEEVKEEEVKEEADEEKKEVCAFGFCFLLCDFDLF